MSLPSSSPPPSTLILFSFLVIPLVIASASALTASIQSFLLSHGLPGGLFPENVKSFTLDPNGLLEVFLDRPCLTKFESKVYFDSVVRANLTYGRLQGLEGLSQEELFLWLPIKDIIVYDPSSGLILFDIGIAHKQLSLSLFEDPPPCKPPSDSVVKAKKKEQMVSAGLESLR
ncbi:hypothetical protein SAY86_026785 [Trapa natans]|uniref:Uncharacterized protein n=1 Tax=Trapa natans TaxID=22666 RepID=A0AAN7QI49_TRANT|nr:hypothetical protein SAY86_026785 [Trapa natans]